MSGIPDIFFMLSSFVDSKQLIPALFRAAEYEYLGKIRPGDVITAVGEVENAYTKAGMNFFVIRKSYQNQHGETVLISRSTIIERH